jgi:hypothetical protein
MTSTPTVAPDLPAIKARQQETWASSDYAAVGARILLMAERLCDAADLRAGSRVVDVATGSGNSSGCAGRAGRSRWPAGRPTGSSASSSRRWARTSRRRPDSGSRCSGGTAARLRELLGPDLSSVDTRERTFVFRYPSAEAFVDFRTNYGPTLKAFAALDEPVESGSIRTS